MRGSFSRCQHLSIISSRFISEKTKLTVCCTSTLQNSACHRDQGEQWFASPSLLGSRLRDWPMPVSYKGLTSVPVGPPPCVHSGVVGGTHGPPCPVPTLESWAAPVVLPAPCPLWSQGQRPWASMPGIHSGVVGSNRGPPCQVFTLELWAPHPMSTLESWAAPVGLPALCPLWSRRDPARWRLVAT